MKKLLLILMLTLTGSMFASAQSEPPCPTYNLLHCQDVAWFVQMKNFPSPLPPNFECPIEICIHYEARCGERICEGDMLCSTITIGSSGTICYPVLNGSTDCTLTPIVTIRNTNTGETTTAGTLAATNFLAWLGGAQVSGYGLGHFTLDCDGGGTSYTLGFGYDQNGNPSMIFIEQ